MLILALDTSTRTGSAALLRDGVVEAEVSGYEETAYSMRLFRDVALLRDRAGFRMGQIDVFAVAAGPGSFTGLRVGLTAVKAWAEVHQKKIAAVSGLEAIATQALLDESQGKSNDRIFAPFLDARRGQVFGAIYRRVNGDAVRLELASEESILSVEEFTELVKGASTQPVLLVSPTPNVLAALLAQEGVPGARTMQVSAALAPAIGRLGFDRLRRGELVDPLRLDANYVRRSDAEAAWKDS
jgi:tRNA threonylcarbamoyladenosine biosynthesis protein TsaB